MTETPNLLDGTEQFMRASRQPIPDVPTIPPASVIALRMRLLIEEVTEAVHAVGFFDLYDYLECAADEGDAEEAIAEFIDNSGTGIRRQFDFPEMIDAFHDIAVIAYGGALETAGRAATKATEDEVTRSNLAKIVDGKVLRRADGKIQKPEGWTGPDIAGALKAHGWVQP